MARIDKNRNKLSMQYMERVSTNVRAYRKSMGWSQNQLAKDVDIRVSTISDIERGEAQNITLENLCKLADGLKVTPEELMAKGKVKLSKANKKDLEQIIKDLKVILLSN